MKKLNPIHIKTQNRGLLHRHLGYHEGAHIPIESLQRAKKSPSAKIRREANFALNAKNWHHSK